VRWLYHILCGYADISIRGMRRERFINQCALQALHLTKVRYDRSMGMTFRIAYFDRKKLEEITSREGVEVGEITIGGLLPWLIGLLRPGMIIGCAAFVVVLAAASGYIWTIEIDGAEDFAPVIMDQLDQMGISPGSRWGNIRLSDISYELMQENDFLTYVIVQKQGVKLYLDVHLTVYPEPAVEKDRPCDIIAEKDTIIEDISVLSGTACVSAGDVVKAGDILITGAREHENGIVTLVRARGEIKGRVWYTATATVSPSAYNVVATGNTFKVKYLEFCGTTSFIDRQPDAGNHALINKTVTPVVGMFIPVFVVEEDYAEVSIDTTEQMYSEAEAAAVAKAELQALKLVPNGTLVTDKIIATKMTQDGTMATVTLQSIEDIGVAQYY